MVRGALTHQIGRRGSFLAFLFLLDAIYAYSLFFPTTQSLQTPTSVFLLHIAPLWVWGLLWGAAGLVCLFYAFHRNDAPGFAAAMFMKTLWSLTFLLGWLFAGVERGYLTATIWGAFAAVCLLISTWPEPPGNE